MLDERYGTNASEKVSADNVEEKSEELKLPSAEADMMKLMM